jgi:hypothetical protein
MKWNSAVNALHAKFSPMTRDVMRIAHGEAALTLIESLLLTLIENDILSQDQVQESVEIAIEAQRQNAEDGNRPDVAHASAGLLTMVANSVAAARRKAA